jgi:pimeloyl-ACP methyl ester carboxylesterase
MSTPTLLSDSSTQYLIEAPEQATNTAVIFLPGISGGVFSDRYLPLVHACHDASFAIVRVEAWKNSDDAQNKSFNDIHADLQKLIDILIASGYSTLYGIGKSFGGAIMLTLQSPDIQKKVLWAPAIGTTQNESTYKQFSAKPLATVSSLLDITLGTDQLSSNTTPTLFIHGTVDTVVPIENSRTMVSRMPNASLAIIEEADHSYKNPQHEAQVVETTVQFLQ